MYLACWYYPVQLRLLPCLAAEVVDGQSESASSSEEKTFCLGPLEFLKESLVS